MFEFFTAIKLSMLAGAVTDSLISYAISKGVSWVMQDRKNYKRRLRKVINATISEYDKRYPQKDMGDKYSFYKSQLLITELLKYRIMSDIYNFNDLKGLLSSDSRIISPNKEQLTTFFEIFISHISKDEKLRELEISDTFQEEIFNISKAIYSISHKIDNLVNTYDGDLEAQWKDRLEAYTKTLKQFKVKTAKDLLCQLEGSFTTSTKHPNDRVLAMIKHQKAVCLSLLQDKAANKEYIAAYKKDYNNIGHKESAVIAYFKIGDNTNALSVIAEIKAEDEYNPIAIAMECIINDSLNSEYITNLPAIVRNDVRFQLTIFNHLINSNKEDVIVMLKVNDLLLKSCDITPTELDIDSFDKSIFYLNILWSEYLATCDFGLLFSPQFSSSDIFEKLKHQLGFIVDKLKKSELDGYIHLFNVHNSIVKYITGGDIDDIVSQKDFLIKNNCYGDTVATLVIVILCKEKRFSMAIDILQKCKVLPFNLRARILILLINENRAEEFVPSFNELYKSVSVIDEMDELDYINNVFFAYDIRVINDIDESSVVADKQFNDENIESMCNYILRSLRSAPVYVNRDESDKIITSLSHKPKIVLYIADLHYYSGDYKYAKAIYDKYLDLTIESRHFVHYVYCLSKLYIETERLMSLLEYSRLNCMYLSEMAVLEYKLANYAHDVHKCIAINEWVHDNNDIERTQYLERKLYLLHILNRVVSSDIIDEYLSSENKNIKEVANMAQIIADQGSVNKAIALLYEYHAEGREDIEVSFMNISIMRPNTEQSILVEYDTVYYGRFVRYKLNDKVDFVEVKRDSAQNSLIKGLLNKKRGDKFELKRNMSTIVDTVEIIRITNEYLHYHDVIMKKAENPHSGLPMESLSFDSNDGDSILKTLMKYAGGSERIDTFKKYLEQYYNYEFPFTNVIANLFNGKFIEGYHKLLKEYRGINSIPVEHLDVDSFSFDDPYIIDLSSLPNLYKLSIQQNIKFKEKFIISRFLVDIIEYEKREILQAPIISDNAIFEKFRDKAVEFNLNDSFEQYEYLQRLLDWINNNCIIQVSPKAIALIHQLDDKGEYYTDKDNIVNYIANTVCLLEDSKGTLITEDLIYLESMRISMNKTPNVELFIQFMLRNKMNND